MRYSCFYIAFFLLFFVANSNAKNFNPVVIDDELIGEITCVCRAFETQSDSIHSENIQCFADQFVPVYNFNPQSAKSTLWFLLEIANHSTKELPIGLNFGHITHVILYEYDSDSLKNPRYSGVFMPLHQIEQKDGVDFFYIDIEAGKNKQLFVQVKHVKGRIPFVKFRIENYFKLISNKYRSRNFLFLLFGFNLMIFFFALYLFLLNKQKVYLWLSIFVFGFSFYELVVSSLFSFIYPMRPDLVWRFLFFFIEFGVIGGILLLINFYDIKRISTFFYNIFRILIVSYIALLVVSQLIMLFPYKFSVATNINLPFALIAVLSIVMFPILCWRNFDKVKRRFSIVLYGYVFFVFVAIVLLISHGDKAIINIVHLNLMSGGVAYVFFLDSIGHSTKKHIKEREDLIEELNKHTLFLEETVDERTDEMAKAYKQQIEQKKELKKQKEHIELLIREVHHRVKNNLQLFLSFYELQIADPNLHDLGKILEDGQKRIRVMALVHDMLYNGKTGDLIEVKNFIKGISDSMKHNANGNVDIEYTIICPALTFDLDTAIPLGLMLNELLTNTIKYAESESNSIRITIILTQISEINFSLEIIDNAKIIDQKSIVESSSSFGIRMIKLISRQMGGNFLFKNEKYNHFIINFMSSEGLKQLQ